MKNYIDKNGRVAREEIAVDVRDGILSKADVERLVKDPKIRSAFIGKKYYEKISKDKWTKEYLNKLPNAAVAEAFNRDYLMYLADVSNYIRTKKKSQHRKRTIIFVIVIAAIIVAIAIVLIICILQRPADKGALDDGHSVELSEEQEDNVSRPS